MAGRRSGRGPDYNWGSFQGEITAVDLAEGTVATGSTGFIFAQAGTVVRMRGLVTAELDAGAATAENALIVLGIIKVSQNAFDVGITAIPNPTDDSGEDWIWQGSLYVSTGSQSGGADFGSNAVDRVVVDSKAMRKIKDGEVFVIVADVAVSDNQTGTADLKYYVRVLEAV